MDNNLPWPALEPLPRCLRINTTSDQLQTTTEHHPISPTTSTPKEWSRQTTEFTGVNPTLKVRPWPAALMLLFWLILTTSKPEGQSHPMMCQQQSRLNCNMNSYTTHTRNTPRTTNSGAQMRETVPLGSMEHLLHKNMLPRRGDMAGLPNIEKQTQRAKTRRQRNKFWMKEQDKTTHPLKKKKKS